MAVKNEEQYEALKDEGMSKERAACIANAAEASKHGGERWHGGGGSSKQGGPRPVRPGAVTLRPAVRLELPARRHRRRLIDGAG